ncbi:serine/threonine-protein kinase [Stratiformator vulcanicus]|uniref:non-specific serine/threonine protein kinase n=1 Tax=Stratiformator vulcanicus TaxID=2527980 RepID=A0A517QYF9_9PLAN|nr:serine/threonine-protein kinase [Stratiformator vulcanicus]QDT36633.1 Serine/threonine-protein kinase PrkC [Stratiformator vulcanicus]
MPVDSTVSAAEESLPHGDPVVEVDLRCGEFLQLWSEGRRPRIEDFLVDTGDLDQSTLLSRLIMLEVRERVRVGEQPQLDDYISRFPTSKEVISRLTPLFRDSGSDLAQPDEATAFLDACTINRLGRFEIDKRLGSGSFGSVWRAWDRKLKRSVAVKIIDRARLEKHEIDLALHEAGAAAQLNHASIVQVHDVGQTDGAFYIVTEYVNGADLKTHLRQGELSHRDAVGMCAQIARALQHAHDNDVIHRDVKPSNVLVNFRGEAKLADFGMARWDKADLTLTAKDRIVGAPGYMAPEQARGRGVGPRSDVYSLGIMLYEMLTGKRPFEGEIQQVLFSLQFREAPRPRKINKTISRDLETIVLKAIQKRPEDRYATADEFAADLQRWLDGEPVKARRVSPMGKVWRLALRQPRTSATLAFGTFLIATAISILGSSLITAVPVDPFADGEWDVQVETKPEGAEITVVQLDEHHQPIAEALTKSTDRTPLTMSLAPGRYLVIATLGTRFHEVHRTVPGVKETIAIGVTKPKHWTLLEEGVIAWPRIDIPGDNITAAMQLVPANEKFAYRALESKGNTVGVPAFFIARNEYKVRDHFEIRDRIPPTVFAPQALNQSMNERHDFAAHWAEESGCRLPTDAELAWAEEFAAANPVFGLAELGAGLDEWTSVRAGSDASRRDMFLLYGGLRRSRQLNQPAALPRMYLTNSRTIGFRLCRSASPRYGADDS